MIKITLIDKVPPFEQTVQIPLHGDGDRVAPVKFTFTHRETPDLEKFINSAKGRKDEAKIVEEIAIGWDLDDEFNIENIQRLLDRYRSAGVAIFNAYVKSIYQLKEKN